MENISGGFVIGIDSGGTKCELLISDLNNKILFNKSFKGVHYSVAGVRTYVNSISGFIKKSMVTAGLNLRNCISIGFGIAGAREENDRIKLKIAFQKKLRFGNILITTDAMTALYGAFEGEEGIILISGTGSVLYGYSNRKLIRVGGWGRIIGDEGSGYWIGKRALNLVMKEYDNAKAKKSLLSKKLFETFGIDKTNVNEKIFNQNFEIQKIAPIVITSAVKKCNISKQIIDEAVQGLIEHIRIFQKVSRRKKMIRIAFIGSIIENKNILSDKLKNEIKKLDNIEVVKKKHNPAFGAVLLAMKDSEIVKKL